MIEMLKQIEQQLEAKIKPEFRDAYDRIVVAGMKVMFSDETHDVVMGFMEKMGADMAKVVPEGVGRLMALLHSESKEMPIEAAIPAGITLMLKALEYVASKGMVELSPEFIAQCTQDTAQKVLEAFGITKEMMDQAVAQGHAQQAQQGA